MIKSDLRKRVLEMEGKVRPTRERVFEKKLARLLDRYGVPFPDDLVLAMTNRDRLDAVDSDWIRSLREKGGIGDLLEILRIMDELNDEQNQLPS